MKKNTYIVWKKNSDIESEKGFFVRSLLAQHASEKGFRAIIDEYVYIYPENIKKTLQLIPGAWESFHGDGVDLGGGVGCISATIALKDEVSSIYCVEFVEDVVALCQPIVAQEVLQEQATKVIPVLGDFDNLELPDNSLDFAVTWDSIHHSYDPIKTLQECRRVLKPGAKLTIIDRAHNNNTPDTEIERMLNVVYDEAFIKRNYLEEGVTIMRKELGEHEWRFNELEHFFEASGFALRETIVIKTDTEENRSFTNDNNVPEVFVPYTLGGFGHRKVGFLLEAIK